MTYILAFLSGMLFELAGVLADEGRKGDAAAMFAASAILIVWIAFMI